jgi:squalene-associated FAD-dependent desaturase
MGAPVVHVIGAGLAGLSAATELAAIGQRVIVHEAAPQAGGRCRSYVDQILGDTIDNGNHLILSGNRAALAYLARIGGRDRLTSPHRAVFDFVHIVKTQRWRLQLSHGRVPWWVLNPARRVPATRPLDYAGLLNLRFAPPEATVGRVLRCAGPVYDCLWRPLLLAALNTEPSEASAFLANAVIKQSLERGGSACRPLIAEAGLSAAFVDPALASIAQHGGSARFGSRLRAIEFDADRVVGLRFADDRITLGLADAVVLAVPGPVAAMLVPGLAVPVEHRAIVNGHFKLTPPAELPRMLGVIGGDVEWIFAYPRRLSTTTSAADRLLDEPRESLAERLWAEVCAATGLSGPLPPWQIVRERRATFAALPSEEARRPKAVTRWRNLVLAGDYTATGLPATIEGAVQSGATAAVAIRDMARLSLTAARETGKAVS